MSTNVKFLKERLIHIKAKLATTPDYIEMIVLERIVKEEEQSLVPIIQKRKYPKRKISREVFPNGKMNWVYDNLVKITSENEGRISIEKAKLHLKKEKILTPQELKNVTTYILHCNKRGGVVPRIFLWPKSTSL